MLGTVSSSLSTIPSKWPQESRQIESGGCHQGSFREHWPLVVLNYPNYPLQKFEIFSLPSLGIMKTRMKVLRNCGQFEHPQPSCIIGDLRDQRKVNWRASNLIGCYLWGHWGLEMAGDQLKFTQEANGRAGIQTQFSWLPTPCYFYKVAQGTVQGTAIACISLSHSLLPSLSLLPPYSISAWRYLLSILIPHKLLIWLSQWPLESAFLSPILQIK